MKEKKQGFTIEEIREQLQWEERHDAQTGTIKIAYLSHYEKLFKNKYVRVAYIRIYGLSYLLDVKGYAVCDEVLHVAGYILVDYFGENHVFRVGLDGFLVVTEHFDEEWYFIDKLEEYRSFISSFKFSLSKPQVKIFVGISEGNVNDENTIDNMLNKCKEKQRIAFEHDLYYVDDHIEDLEDLLGYHEDSRKDHLTGLMNMDAFIEYSKRIINTEFTKELKKVIIYFNIENFKAYNENYGFKAGNELIRELGTELKKTFPNRLVSRFAEDHFLVLTYEKGVEEKIESIATQFLAKYITLKAGIYRVDHLASKNITVACDKAKIACDAIKRKYNVHFNYFNSEMDSMIRLEQYIVDHIDEALQKKWIKIYFQPVIRTLSQSICGFEALSRWDDPQFGMIRPDVFIGVLERYHLITKLSDYVVDCICEKYAYYVDKAPAVPVSINFSILDFESANLLERIDRKLEKVNLPRELFQIEVTESLLSNNQDYMKKQIKKFNDAGYLVWLDDFGSGYSSLNVLKDYKVDTLKIDMLFLRNFSERSKTIIEFVVNMAKALGIHTLAEGVETKEHFDFLKDIGCEKIQGYYFGKPEPMDDIMSKVIRGEADIEDQNQRYFYKDIGKINQLSNNPFGDEGLHITNVPIGIFQQKDNKVEFLYTNEFFLNELVSIGIETQEELARRIDNQVSSTAKRVQEALDSLEYGEETSMDYIDGNNLIALRYKNIAVAKDRKAYLMSVRNLSKEYSVLRNMRLDETKQTIYALFDQVYLVNLKNNTVETIYTHVGLKKENNISNLTQLIDKTAKTMIYIDDRDRFIEFMNLEDINTRLENTHVVSEAFRYVESSMEYKWRIFELSYANNKDKVIFSIRPIDESKKNAYLNFHGYSVSKDTGLTEEALWNTLKDQVPAGLFWKDTNRRFVGVNKMFRDYYGIKSMDDIVGKNDEEMGWHVDPDPFMNDEIRVLQKGERTRNVPGKCLCKGENREIAASKMPVYNDGKIVGLLGYFVDITDEKKRANIIKSLGNHDSETGMLNWNGIMANSMYYIEGYQLRNQEFMIVYINVLNITYYNHLHGKEVLTHMLQNVGEQISKYIGVTGVVGYIGMGKFVVLKQFENKKDMVKVKRELLAHISTVTQVDRISFTLRFNIGMCAFSETNDMELAYRLAQQRASKNYSIQEDDDVKQKIAEEMNKYQEIFDVVRCVDIDSYKTYILEDDKLKEVEKRCYEFFEKDHPCSSCIAKKALITHEEWAKIIYNGATHVVIARAMPIKGRNFVLIYTKKLNKES